jgi:hypothetical protein
VIFFVGLHHPADAKHFEHACISVNTIWWRQKPIEAGKWIMDSGAFTEISTHGRYRLPVEEYAKRVERWSSGPNLLAAVSEDWMCEPFILSKTGLSIVDHQRLTIERYDALRALVSEVAIIPVLQGYAPEDYVNHVRAYGARLYPGMWVGVGSICKRNAKPEAVEAVLRAIKAVRPDLLLHGFGVKITALRSKEVRGMLWSADSMAWSFAARKNGRDANDWREAKDFEERINDLDGEEIDLVKALGLCPPKVVVRRL